MRPAVALVLLTSLAACGLGEKEGFADRVTAAPAAAIARGTVAGTITTTFELTKAPIDIPEGQGGPALELTSDFVADLGAHRSRIEQTHLVHDDLVIHLRRADARENDARPWLTLDVADLPDSAGIPFVLRRETNLPFAVFTIPPTVLVDLIAGALTGSLESLGRDDIGGVRVDGFGGRFDLDKMLFDTRDDDYDHDRVNAVEHAFEILDIPERVHTGSVWLDDDGLPRRFRVTFEQKPRPRWTFAVTMTLDLTTWGAPASFDLPATDETIEITSLSRLVAEISASFPPPQLPGLPTPPTTVPSGAPVPPADEELIP